MTDRFESAHLSLPLLGRLVGVFGPVVQALVLPVFHGFQDLFLGCPIAGQLKLHIKDATNFRGYTSSRGARPKALGSRLWTAQECCPPGMAWKALSKPDAAGTPRNWWPPYIDDKNDFIPAVLIPANGQILKELEARWRSQNNEDPFYDPARPVASTMLVAVAWSEKALFPDGRFRWGRLEQALKAQTWAALGGPASWGSFDFVLTDPSRSNSAQLALALLSGGNPNNPANPALFSLVKASVYNPPRSTDILLQEFIARGPNDADVAIVYESIALNRWEQSATNQGKPYQIYYLDPTYRTTSTAAIVRRRVDAPTADAARTFLDFLGQPEQQAVFVRHGFRPATDNLDVAMVPGSPWNKTIPGARAKPAIQILSPPNPSILEEIKKLWSRSN